MLESRSYMGTKQKTTFVVYGGYVLPSGFQEKHRKQK
jgi:hypothetical protein